MFSKVAQGWCGGWRGGAGQSFIQSLIHLILHSFTQPLLCDSLDEIRYSEGCGNEELAGLRGLRETNRNQLAVRGDGGGGLQDAG